MGIYLCLFLAMAPIMAPGLYSIFRLFYVFRLSVSIAARASESSGCAYRDNMAVVDQRMTLRTVSGAMFSEIARAVAVVCRQE